MYDPITQEEPLPPPISGGTLLVTRDGLWAVASEPDTDRIYVVGIGKTTPGCADCDANPRVLSSIQLAAGEQPGRVAEDAHGRVHVVLRRGGAIATVDLASGTLLARRPVCAAPRGIAYEAKTDLLHVACSSGVLVSLSPASGEIQRHVRLDVDLRDVVVVPNGLVVSRFKTAELIRVSPGGKVVARIAAKGIDRGSLTLTDRKSDPLEPAVAWRTVASDAGHVFMLHQYGLAREIDLRGGASNNPPPSPYGGQPGAKCGGIVEQTVSELPFGGDIVMGRPMPVLALTVDIAVSADGDWIVAVHPGSLRDTVTFYRSVTISTWDKSPVFCANDEGRALVPSGTPIAVSLFPGRTPGPAAAEDWLVVQSRAPGGLGFYRGFTGPRVTVLFDEPDVHNAGHHLFHMDAGNGIACAQCHPEGAEDGRVWKFLPTGSRRTQAVHVGLDGTEPFHWEGDLAGVPELLDDTFVRRMGGTPPGSVATDSLKRWLFSLRPPEPIVTSTEPAARRGRKLFESPELGCSGCHAGPALTNNTSHDVGVESPAKFQVPSLRGVGYRAPFLHNGCAKTLRDRFNPACGGGDRHGITSTLSATQLDDLLAYLQSL